MMQHTASITKEILICQSLWNFVSHKQQHMGRGKEGMLLYDIYLQ